MKLLTKEILEKFEKQGDVSEKMPDEIMIVCKFFNPVGAGTWYLYQYDPEQEIFWGFANLGDPEMAEEGTIALKDFTDIQLPFGMGIERDINFGYNHTLKEVMDIASTESLVEDLLREGIEVAEAAGVTFDEGFFENGVRHLKTAGYHKPSMLQDVERGAMTEIDWLNGKIVEHAHARGLQAPNHAAITRLVKGLETRSMAPREH